MILARKRVTSAALQSNAGREGWSQSMLESRLKFRNQNLALDQIAVPSTLRVPACEASDNDNSRYPQSNIGIECEL